MFSGFFFQSRRTTPRDGYAGENAQGTGGYFRVGIFEFFYFASSSTRALRGGAMPSCVQVGGLNRIDPHWGRSERLAARTLAGLVLVVAVIIVTVAVAGHRRVALHVRPAHPAVGETKQKKRPTHLEAVPPTSCVPRCACSPLATR